MKEHPLLLTGPEVRAVNELRKTQFRRVVKEQPPDELGWLPERGLMHKSDHDWHWLHVNKNECDDIRCPWGQPGDRLWVRETWAPTDSVWPVEHFSFRADGDDPGADGNWRPSSSMPKRACRLWLTVKDVRVERLQSISHRDCEAEGATHEEARNPGIKFYWRDTQPALWDAWSANDWVWAVTFEKEEA